MFARRDFNINKFIVILGGTLINALSARLSALHPPNNALVYSAKNT